MEFSWALKRLTRVSRMQPPYALTLGIHLVVVLHFKEKSSGYELMSIVFYQGGCSSVQPLGDVYISRVGHDSAEYSKHDLLCDGSCIVECGDPRQLLALEELQASTSTRGNVADLAGNASFLDCSNAVAASDYGGTSFRGAGSQRLGNLVRAVRERIPLENSERAVPDNGFCLRNFLLEVAHSLCTDVKAHPAVGDVVDGYLPSLGIFLELAGDNDVLREEQLYSFFFRLLDQVTSHIDEVFLDQGSASRDPESAVKREDHPATEQNAIAFVQERLQDGNLDKGCKGLVSWRHFFNLLSTRQSPRV